MKSAQLQWNYNKGWLRSAEEEKLTPDLILVFGIGEYFRTKAYEDLRALYPQANIVGCSTAGAIFDDKIDDTCIATLLEFQKGYVEVVKASCEHMEDSKLCGVSLVSKLYQKQLKHIFVLSDGLNINGSQLVEGMNEALEGEVIITGGLAADEDRFEKTFVIANEQALPNQVVAIGFYGDSFEIQSGCMAGWDEFGPERLVTKSKNNIVYEIDGRPALDLYKTYLGPETQGLPNSGLRFPISLRANNEEHTVIRSIVGIDEEENSLIFAGDVPSGYICRLMKTNINKLIEHAGDAASEALSSKAPAGLCLAVSCVGRRLVLSQLVEEELDAIKEVLGEQTVLAGFYSYGEIAPIKGLKSCQLHNQTMTLTTISELV